MKITAVLLGFLLISPILCWLFPDDGISKVQETWFTLCLTGLCFYSCFLKKASLRISVTEWLLLLGLGWYVLALLPQKTTDVWLYQTRHIVLMVLLYLQVRLCLTAPGDFLKPVITIGFTFLAVLLTSAGMIAAAGHLFYSRTLSPAAITPFGNSGLYAVLMTLLLPYCVYLVWHTRRRPMWRWVLVPGLSAITVTVLLLESRTAWIILSVQICILLIYSLQKRWYRWLVAAMPILALLAMKLAFPGFKIGSAKGRTLIYEITGNILHDHWPGGIGLNQFKAHFLYYQADYLSRNSAGAIYAADIHYAFNEYLQLMCEAGIVPVLLLLASLITLLFRFHKTPPVMHPLLLTASVSICSFGIASLFSYPLHEFSCSLVLTISSALFFHSIRPDTAGQPPGSFGWKLACICAIIPWTISTWNSYRLGAGWKKADFAMQAGQFKNALPAYSLLYTHLRTQDKFLYDYGRCAFEMQEYVLASNLLEELSKRLATTDVLCLRGLSLQHSGHKQAATQLFLTAHNAVPLKLWPQYLLMQHFFEVDNMEGARRWASKLLATPVKMHSEQTAHMKAAAFRIISLSATKLCL